MWKHLCAFFVLALFLASPVRAAILWQNIDSDFQILNGLDLNPSDPKTYTIQVKNISANNYTNVHIVIPFQWNLDVINETTVTGAVAGTWDNTGAKWDNGGYGIKITNYAYLTQMSDTDISMSWPLTVPDVYMAVNASINGTDSVPNVYVGDLNSGQTVSFNVDIDFTPGFVPTEFTGYFVKPVPEPTTIGLLAISAMGLLIRRR